MALQAPNLSPTSRKRKAGPFELDWNALLGDNELPQLLVFEAAKSKPEVIMLGEDEESHKDLYLQGTSDRELADMISRAENMLAYPSNLPDSGAKLRVLRKRQVAERERRKLPKADGNPTISKATLLADMPIHIDHTNDSSQSNREHFGRHLSTPSHRHPDKTVSSYFEKKENAPRVQPICSSKTSNIERPFILVDEEELKVDAVNQVGQSKLGEKVQLPISYLLNSLPDMGPILERITISEQAQFGTALLGRALNAFASAHGGFLQLEAENKKLSQHNSVLVKDHKSFQSEVNSLKSALAAQTARAERASAELALAQAKWDSWLKEKEELIAAHKAELEAVKEKSRAEGYKQGQDELKGLQRPFHVGLYM